MIEAKLRKLQKRRSEFLLEAVEELHDFVHTARDDAVQYLERYKAILAQFLQDEDLKRFHEQILEEFQKYLHRNLQKVVTLFEALNDRPRKLWVAVRRLEEPEREYRTILRVGKYSKDREVHSLDIPESTGLPQYLRQQYERNRGIVILGPNRSAATWMSTQNDALGEDRSVLIGPIMIKSGNPLTASEKRELYMILYVNSPEENAFSTGDEYYMRCCTDVLSLFFSMASKMMEETGFGLVSQKNA